MKSLICKNICNPTSAVVLFFLCFFFVEKGRGEVITVTQDGFIYEMPEIEFHTSRSGKQILYCEGHRTSADSSGAELPSYYMNWIAGASSKLVISKVVFDTMSIDESLEEPMRISYGDVAEIIDTFIVRGVKGVTVRINPFRYDLAAKKLIRMTRCEVTVESEATKPVELGATFYNLLKKSIPNYKKGILKRQDRAKENYLILAESGFHNALAPLIAHREKEYNVSVLDAALLGGNQMLIINKIKELYANPETRPTYLLLVGGFPLLPMNNPISTSSLGTPLNDLWYGAVDGDDHYADILVGRFSLNSGENDKVKNCVAKTIAYEERGLATPKRNLYIAAGGPFAEHAIEPMNYVDGTYFVPGGYSCTRLFESEIADITTDMVSDEVNAGLDFLFYSGHGNWDHWKTGHVFGEDIKKMTNDSYPIVFSFACLTGDLSTVHGECFGETWLNETGGAVAFLGASTETTWEPDDHFQRMVVDGIFDTTITTLQGAISYGKMSLDQNFPKYGIFYSETFNLCGDPALKVAVPELETAVIQTGDIHATSSLKATIEKVSDGFRIEASTGNIIASLCNVQGREVVKMSGSNPCLTLPTANLSRGAYILQVKENVGGQSLTQRVIIK